ncbi:phosphonate ABC transporter, permease protein PhnE [Pseudonocardia sp. GCM10023141]|uniref:phosphonate ABC transporter, permease protein PhnE n=1 Tax=Pseudonocardia sp. GCM10023141 TaxID=3252653 RepID=UPI003620C104
MTVTAVATRVTPPRPSKPRRIGAKLWSLGITAVVVLAFWSVEIDWSQLADFPASLVRYLGLMFAPPDLTALPTAFEATIQSVQMAWLGTVIGIVVSLPLSFLSTAGVGPAVLRWPLRGLFALLRAVPEVVIAVLILSVTGLTAFTGALAIGIGSIGTLGKWGYETMEGAEPGPIEAVRAAGGSTTQMLRWGLWPSVQPEVLAFWLYRFEINVRASAILGLIGAGGIGKTLADNVQFRIWDSVGTLLIVVVVVTVLIDLASGTLRRRLIDGRWPWTPRSR